MYKFYVTYISSTDDDVCHVWTMADSVEDAKSEIRSEYWDVKEIIEVTRAR